MRSALTHGTVVLSSFLKLVRLAEQTEGTTRQWFFVDWMNFSPKWPKFCRQEVRQIKQGTIKCDSEHSIENILTMIWVMKIDY